MAKIETLEEFRLELRKVLEDSCAVAIPVNKEGAFEYDTLELAIASLALDYVEGFSRRIIHDTVSGKG